MTARASQYEASDVLTYTSPNGLEITILASDALKAPSGSPYLGDDGTLALPGYAFRDDVDTGMFRSAANVANLGAGGEECMEFAAIAAAPAVAFYGTTAIVKQTGVAVTEVAIHAALVALGLIAGP